jgi:hypothetical protein
VSDINTAGVFPNPAKDRIRIIFSVDAPCLAVFTVFSVSGEKAAAVSMQPAAGFNSMELKLRNNEGVLLSSGTYIYRLELTRGNKIIKIFHGKFSVAR